MGFVQSRHAKGWAGVEVPCLQLDQGGRTLPAPSPGTQLSSGNSLGSAGAAVSGYKLGEWKLRLGMRKKFTMRVLRSWNRLLREVVDLGKTWIRLLCQEVSLLWSSDQEGLTQPAYIFQRLCCYSHFTLPQMDGRPKRGSRASPAQ